MHFRNEWLHTDLNPRALRAASAADGTFGNRSLQPSIPAIALKDYDAVVDVSTSKKRPAALNPPRRGRVVWNLKRSEQLAAEQFTKELNSVVDRFGG